MAQIKTFELFQYLFSKFDLKIVELSFVLSFCVLPIDPKHFHNFKIFLNFQKKIFKKPCKPVD